MNTSTSFSYANRHSDDFGISFVRIGGGLVEEAFLHSTSVQYKKPRNRNKILIENITEEPLVIPMTLFFNERLTEQRLREVRRWLNQTSPQPLVFDSNTDRIYYAIKDGSTPMRHNGGLEGYIELEMLTTSPYAFGMESVIQGTSTNEVSSEDVLNSGDDLATTIIEITIPPTDVTDVQITNLATEEMLVIRNNLPNEKITFYSEYEEIETSSDLRYGYDDHNNVFINLVPGNNEIQFVGNFSYQIKHQPILF